MKLKAKREYCPRDGTGQSRGTSMITKRSVFKHSTGQSEDPGSGSDDDDDGPPECASTCQIDPNITPTCEDIEGYITGCASSCSKEIKLEAKREYCPREGTGQSR